VISLFSVLGLGVMVAGVMMVAPPAMAASLQEVSNFGENPTKLKMYVYKPNNMLAKPPVVVAVHYCHGDAVSFYNGSEFARLADKYGFLLIFPSVTQASDSCFDVASKETLTHGAGGDSLGVVSMVRYAVAKFNADDERVYATGVSSGAMMTNVLLGSYPDVFKAGSAFAGVPFGCFAVNPDALRWSDDCAKGRVTRTARQWGDTVRDAYPGYTGPRPRMQLWHGTNDEILNYVNFSEAIEQWTNVHGVTQNPISTEQNTPQAGWTRTRYGAAGENALVEAVSMRDTSHNLPVQAAAAIHFFGLDTPGTGTSPAGPAPAGTCSATASTVSRWATGFVVSVTVTAGGSPVTGWKVTMSLAGGTTIGGAWNGQSSGTSGTVIVTNAASNGVLAAGASTSFGFQGTGSDDAITATCVVR
jgi:poly(hydroxyalkanoate) depolymerase family esterase